MTYLSALSFPKRIAMGAERTPAWATTVSKTFGGLTYRNQNRSRALLSWDVGFAVRTESDFEAVLDHFHACRGQAHTFPFRDKQDSTDDGRGTLALVSGSIYQMQKAYGAAANECQRKITRPASVVVTRTRAGTPTVISPSVDYTTGRVTVSGHVAGDTYTWTGVFDTPARYASDELQTVAVNRRPNAGDLLIDCGSIMIEEDLE